MSKAYLSRERRSFVPETLANIEQATVPVSYINQILAYDQSQNSILVPCNSPALTPSNSFHHELVPGYVEPPEALNEEASSTMVFAPEELSTTISSFNVSIISDTGSDDDDDDECNLSNLDAFLHSQQEYAIPQRPSSTSQCKNVGLGISGISRKKEKTPFDGLGLVALHDQSSRPSLRAEAITETNTYDAYGEVAFSPSLMGMNKSDSTSTLSETFLHEMLLTFSEDPFHTQMNSIPDCKSWYELDDLSSSKGKSSHTSVTDAMPPSPSPLRHRYHRTCGGSSPSIGQFRCGEIKLKRNFSSATISSELKRTTKAKSCSPSSWRTTSRARSASWPMSKDSSLRDCGPNSGMRSPWRT